MLEISPTTTIELQREHLIPDLSRSLKEITHQQNIEMSLDCDSNQEEIVLDQIGPTDTTELTSKNNNTTRKVMRGCRRKFLLTVNDEKLAKPSVLDNLDEPTHPGHKHVTTV